MNVCVLVLGDVGRSPRMQYHTLSLAESQFVKSVKLVGVKGQQCIPDVRDHKKVEQILIRDSPVRDFAKHWFLLAAPIKVIVQSAQLFTVLMRIENLDVMLIQNPPCIPTFLIAGVVKLVKGTHVVIDWHNLAYTILQYKTKGPVLTFARFYEIFLGARIGDAHICVTEALKKWLEEHLKTTNVTVQYDKPPKMFYRRKLASQHAFFERVKILDSNIFTLDSQTMHPERPFIIVSSTSWTPDEDFGILLTALCIFDKKATRNVLVIVTGKGPQKEMYLEKISRLNLKFVTVRTLWLEPEDYPRLLGSADLGVCLHTSSSNLDLPMKVVDMFGSSLPVCAISYPCLNELVKHEENGLVFDTEVQLADQLEMLIESKEGNVKLEQFRQHIETHYLTERWNTHWTEKTSPIIEKLGTAGTPKVLKIVLWVGLICIILIYLSAS